MKNLPQQIIFSDTISMGFLINKVFRFTEKLVRKHKVSIYPLPHPSVQLPLLLTSCVGVLRLLKLKNQY